MLEFFSVVLPAPSPYHHNVTSVDVTMGRWVLLWESQYEGYIALSLRSLVVDKEKMKSVGDCPGWDKLFVSPSGL